MICPAFQSSFIYDDEERQKLFAYFEDSVPVINPFVNKDRYGIMEKVGRSKRERRLRTVRMEIIFPEDPADSGYMDSTLVASNDLSGLSLHQIDSLNNHRSGPVNRYNVEQDTYMKLFGEYLSFPEPVMETTEAATDEEEDPADYSSMTRKERRQAKRAEKRKRKQEEASLSDQSSQPASTGEDGS